MKKSTLALLFAAVGSVLPASSCGQYDLVVFNWGEYMPMENLRVFEKEYQVKVNYITYDSNELLLSKLDTSAFDVAFPSDYAIEELAVKEKIMPLRLDLLTNYDPETSLVPSLRQSLELLKADQMGKKGFDLLKYAVPYTWGEIGILFNTQKISREEVERDGWEALRRTTNADGSPRKVVIYEAARDMFSMALIANGKDIVDVPDADVELAADWLKEQKKNLKNNIVYKTEEILDDMPNLKYDICFTYAGDAIYAIDSVKNSDGEYDPSLLDFYIPDQLPGAPTRTNIYVDAMAISKETRNVELAHQFVDFMLRHDVAYENTLYNGYTSPLSSIYEEITSEYSPYEEGEGTFYGIRDAYRVSSQPSDKFYRYDEKLKNKLEEAWIRVKNSRS